MNRATSLSRTLIATSLLTLGTLAGSALHAADLKGSQDHPLVPRYDGSEIIKYETSAYTRHSFAQAAVRKGGGFNGNPGSELAADGKLTTLVYRAPEKRSPLEVLRNYEEALTKAGFTTAFSCVQRECGGYEFNTTLIPLGPYSPLFNGYHENHGYVLARLARGEGDVLVSAYVVKNMGGGINRERALVKLDVLELKPMEQRMVTLKASEIDAAIGAEGKVALYGILFDTDKDTMRADSKPQLDEIAALLQQNTHLKVLIVGHTDAQGTLAHNQDLSQRRARTIAAALTKDYQIAASRLTPVGVGMAAPVASNRNEAGRAKNRRVELVETGTAAE
ncbi:MAG: DUF4892 domain-containing protein [Burkholderiales bacterium]|nr:DUF4892 domain-containing protein [Burkholderiales bacterium]